MPSRPCRLHQRGVCRDEGNVDVAGHLEPGPESAWQPRMGLAQVHQWHLANCRGGEGQHQVQRVSKGWCCMRGQLMQSKGAPGSWCLALLYGAAKA